jgi:hypothetical protein
MGSVVKPTTTIVTISTASNFAQLKKSIQLKNLRNLVQHLHLYLYLDAGCRLPAQTFSLLAKSFSENSEKTIQMIPTILTPNLNLNLNLAKAMQMEKTVETRIQALLAD